MIHVLKNACRSERFYPPILTTILIWTSNFSYLISILKLFESNSIDFSTIFNYFITDYLPIFQMKLLDLVNSDFHVAHDFKHTRKFTFVFSSQNLRAILQLATFSHASRFSKTKDRIRKIRANLKVQ